MSQFYLVRTSQIAFVGVGTPTTESVSQMYICFIFCYSPHWNYKIKIHCYYLSICTLLTIIVLQEPKIKYMTFVLILHHVVDTGGFKGGILFWLICILYLVILLKSVNIDIWYHIAMSKPAAFVNLYLLFCTIILCLKNEIDNFFFIQDVISKWHR